MSEAKTKVWEQYRNGLSYQSAMGFSTDFPTFVDFKEGRQWPQATQRTKNLPRPVFNVIKMFIRTKRSAVINQPVSINYAPAEVSMDEVQRELAASGAKDFSDYGKQLWESLDQDGLNEDMVDDAATLGTGILHYYFDASVTGGMTSKYVGEVRGESIDPLNIIFSDPQTRDEQKQRYIIIAQRKSVEDVKELAKKEKLPPEKIELICSDNDTSAEGYTAATHEMSGEDKITLLTKYYRKNGAVYFDKCTESVEIIKGRCLSPAVQSKNGAAPAYTIKLYPIVVFQWEKRKKCIFGIGECEPLIPAQKSINFSKAMEMLSVQQTGWPKIKSKPGALQQTITNEPGEVIIDYSGSGSGIDYMSPPPMNAAASNLTASVFDLMRTTSGVSEVSTGEPIGSNIAASAIIALQSQARSPIEEIQNRYWKCIRKVGAIWAELIKAYYNMERNLTAESAESGDPLEETRPFTGSAYADVDFKLKIDVGASSEYGEVLAQSTLDMMLQRGDITIDEYVELAPHNVVPFAERFKKMRKESGKAEQALLARAMSAQQAETPMMPAEGAAPMPLTQPTGTEGVNLPPVPTAPHM